MQFARPMIVVTLLLSIAGCEAAIGAKAGSEAAARKHFQAEFQKWMAGQSNEVSTSESRLRALLAPVSYDIRSVVEDTPDPLAFDESKDLPENWKEWPAYRFNVAIEWKSEAGTPVEKITTYRLTWNSHESKWYVAERFE